MSWSRTLGDLTNDVLDRVDLTAHNLRHPQNTVRRRLIESYQRLREWMTNQGSNFWVGGPYLLDQTSPELLTYGCSLPIKSIHGSGAVQTFDHLRRVEAFYQNGWREVQRQSIFSADTWLSYIGPKYPLEFFVVGQGLNPDGASWVQGDPTSAVTPFQDGQLRLVLMPYLGDGSCEIRIYGLPSVDLVDDYQTRLTLDGPGFDWLIYDACIKLAVRDNDSQNLYQMLNLERSNAAAEIKRAIARETSIPARRRDVYATADRNRARYRRF